MISEELSHLSIIADNIVECTTILHHGAEFQIASDEIEKDC